jgi:hypothetical protein
VREPEYFPRAYQAILALPARTRLGVLVKIDDIVAAPMTVKPLGVTGDGTFWTMSRSGYVIAFDVEKDQVLILAVMPSAAFFRTT